MLRQTSAALLAVITSLPLSAPVWGANIVAGLSSPGAGWFSVALHRAEPITTKGQSSDIHVLAQGGNRFALIQQDMHFWIPPATSTFFMLDHAYGTPATRHDVLAFRDEPEMDIEVGPLRKVGVARFEQRFSYNDGPQFWVPCLPIPEPASALLLLLAVAALKGYLRVRLASCACR